MQLPVMPPVKPMLAKSVPDVPQGEFQYEPKWDYCRFTSQESGEPAGRTG